MVDDRIPARADARRTLAVLAGCGGYVLAVAFLPGFAGESPVFCPAWRFLGLHCATCGLTRAMACLARLDVVAAVRFNPLVILAAPLIAVLATDACRRAVDRPGVIASLPKWLKAGCLAAGLVLVATILVVRTASWLEPAWNPDGWLLPPAAFPPAEAASGVRDVF